MATEVTLPELGESVTEGTITAWLVRVGEQVEADQPLFELSSDKIDTEVPAPVSGVLKEIRVGVDETVDVGTVVAVIGAAGQEVEVEEAEVEEPEVEEPEVEEPEVEEPEVEEPEVEEPEVEESTDPEASASAPEGSETRTEEAEAEEPDEPVAEEPAPEPDRADYGGKRAEPSDGGTRGVPMSPLVRRMVAEHDLDVTRIAGSGMGGRITRSDVDAVLSRNEPAPAPAAAAKAAPKPQPAPPPARKPMIQAGARTRVEDISRIRQRIAAKMMESLQSSAQLTTVAEADVTVIMRLRDRVKDEFRSREGVSLSPFVFLCRAAVLAIRNHPAVNALADWESGTVAYHDYVNLGIAVDTEKGLIVPNIKGADDLSLAGLARAISGAASRARGQADSGRLEIADLEGGTFTMTNTGSRGVLIDTPILNYPEVAILGTGTIKKRPVVVEDSTGPAIAVRDMVYLSLTYDHRLIDGADAARFVTAVKEIAETHDWPAEVGY